MLPHFWITAAVLMTKKIYMHYDAWDPKKGGFNQSKRTFTFSTGLSYRFRCVTSVCIDISTDNLIYIFFPMRTCDNKATVSNILDLVAHIFKRKKKATKVEPAPGQWKLIRQRPQIHFILPYRNKLV